MIPLSEINKIAQKYSISVDTIEKDYIISWILYCLMRSNLAEDFIFYGGTAIKRMYFEDHRFSEDIDLISSKTFSKAYIINELSALEYAEVEANIQIALDPEVMDAKTDRLQLYFNYLGFSEIVGPKKIKIDFTMDREPFGETIKNPIIKSYSDLPDSHHMISVMTLNTILANKLGMIIDATRNEPRDIYDIWFLLNRIDKFDFSYDKILRICKYKYGFKPYWRILKPYFYIPSMARLWQTRLKNQISNLPDIELVVNNIENALLTLEKNTY